jgi:aspartate aminotransferase
MDFTHRIKNISPSKSVQLSSLVSDLKDQGENIISLNVGEADFETPWPIIQGTHKALSENKTRYGLVQGIVELRKKIADHFNKLHKIKVTKDHVLLGNGSKHILYSIFQTICNIGDEIIIPRPYWVTFPESVKLAGGRPIFVDTVNHQLHIENIEKAITSKTKAILINSPNNPTGAIYSKKTLLELVALAKKNNLYIISDEAYERFSYDGLRPCNISSLSEDAFQRTITVQSFSKTYFMTGFRIGYLIGPIKLAQAVQKFQGHVTGNNCTFAQYGALAALEMDHKILDESLLILEKRRNLAYSLFSQLFDCLKPQGAFYLFPHIKKYIDKGYFKSCEEMAEYILKKAKVAVLPGRPFGMENHLRISFAVSEQNIKEAFLRIKELL